MDLIISIKQIGPSYNKHALQQLCTPEKIAADKANMLQILQNWKNKQAEEKPVMIFINVSGGGLRSGTFVMNTLQQLDSAVGWKTYAAYHADQRRQRRHAGGHLLS